MSHGKIEIETCILGGLPVRVTATINPAEEDIGIFFAYPEVEEIYWLSGHPVPKSIWNRMTPKEMDLLLENIMEEAGNV